MANTYKGYGLTPQGNAVPYSGGSAPASVLEAENAQKLGGVPAGDYALKTDTVANSEMLDGKAPEHYLPAVNLLVNSDFANSVNQRGQTVYEFDSGYTIDRWRLHWSGYDGRLTVKNGYIELYRPTYNVFLFQHPEDPETMVGKTYTVAAKCRCNGAIGWIDSTQRISTPDVHWDDWGILTYTFTVGSATPDASGMYGVEIRNSSNLSFEIAWVALYEGSYTAETLPPYVPKGYAEELLACKVSDTGGIDADTLGGKPPEYYLQPENLLVNSYFVNPVNQRGKTSANYMECLIDRWYAFGSGEEGAEVTFNSNGMVFSSGRLTQRIPIAKIKDNQYYTVAVYYADGTCAAKSGVVDHSKYLGQYRDFFAIYNDLTMTVSIRGSNDFIEVTIGETTEKTIMACALYEGTYTAETLPPYAPKGYSTELLACGVADKGKPFFEADALTLEEIAASTDLTGKIPNAQAVAEVTNILNFKHLGDTGESTVLECDLTTLNAPDGLYEIVTSFQYAIIRNQRGTWFIVGKMNQSLDLSIVDNIMTINVGTWYGTCNYRRIHMEVF